jgi:hypothetical protein
MHWFWRGAIAIGAGITYSTLLYTGPRGAWTYFHIKIAQSLRFILEPVVGVQLGFEISTAIAYALPIGLLVLVVFGLLTRYWGRRLLDPETRCRKCGYILRGISEPRCSECGEVI